MFDLGKKLGIRVGDFEPWYKIGTDEVIKAGGESVLRRHKKSMVKLLSAVFPEHTWATTKFAVKPRNFWRTFENQVSYLNEIGERLGIQKGNYEAWYNVTYESILKNGGNVLLGMHDNNASEMISGIFRDHSWDLSKFASKPRNYWMSFENQRQFMIDLGKALGITEGDYGRWYRVTYDEIAKNGGWRLLTIFNHSPSNLIISSFREHEWNLLQFVNERRSNKGSRDTAKPILTFLEQSLGISNPNDWSRISLDQITDLKVVSRLSRSGGLIKILKRAYPLHDWTELSLRMGGTAA